MVRGKDSPAPLPLVIIGAGPAGLAAANSAASAEPVVLEAGPALKERETRDDPALLQGVGGAGLYSDGKFSFWPSASALWNLDLGRLRAAYEWLTESTKDMDIKVPPFPSDLHLASSENPQKKYPSLYATLETRKSLIERLSAGVNIRTGMHVSSVERRRDRWYVHTEDGSLTCSRVIFATGRFGSLLHARSSHLLQQSPRRVEVGFRIEQRSQDFFLRDHTSVDPKYILRDDDRGVEWRTFCCCRDGLIEAGSFGKITSVSGRADGPPTRLSNVGFNVRYKQPADIKALWPEVLGRVEAGGAPFRTSLADFAAAIKSGSPNPVADAFGARIAGDLLEGLSRLRSEFPAERFRDAQLVGPAIEGVGHYLTHDHELHTSAPDAWVVGDTAGSFRGLTAALLSGYLGGRAALWREES